MDFISDYLNSIIEIAQKINQNEIMNAISCIKEAKLNSGRLFIIGVGGGAGHAGHAVNDFRKIVGIETYAPTDNVSELTARINDEGWKTCYSEWLKVSKLNEKDILLIFSVGGGNEEYGLSLNIIETLKLAKERRAKIIGIVGRDGGETAKNADACVIVPTIKDDLITVLTESYQAVIWHLFVAHPALNSSSMRWESVKTGGKNL